MKRLWISGLACLAIAAPVSADESTVDSMGGIGLYIKDDTNQFLFPTTLADYAGNAYLELKGPGTTNASRTAGATFTVPKFEDTTFGVYLNRPTPPGLLVDDYDGALHIDRYHAIMAQRGSVAIGLGFGGDSVEDTTLEDTGGGRDEKANLYQLLLGAEGNWFGSAMSQLGVQVALGSGEIQSEDAEDSFETDSEESSLAIAAGLRNWYSRGSKGDLVAQAGVTFMNGEVDPADDDGDPDVKNKRNALAAGTGLGWHAPVSGSAKVVMVCEPFGISIAKSKQENPAGDDTEREVTVTTMQLPSFFFGMQAAVNKWLTGRVGVAQVFTTTTIKDEATGGGETVSVETENWDSNFDISFGLGAKIGKNWMVNGVFNDQHFFGGPDFLTGAGAGPLLAKVSVNGTWN